MRHSVLAACVVAVAAAAFVPSGASAQEEPDCTLVVTEDTVLDHDIACGRSLPAIAIGAPNVTLDLGGHTVSHGSFPAPTQTPRIVNQGYDGVTIKNGFVDGDSGGAISIEHAQRNTVRDLHVEDYLDFALRLTDVDHSYITRNRLIGYGNGGLALRQGSDRNVVTDNDTGGFRSGLYVYGGSSHNLIINNTSNTGNVDIAVGAGTGNVLALNNASSKTGSVGDTGIVVDAAAVRTVLIGNRASGHYRDGINVESRSTTLIANVANDNGDYGIEAVPGVFGVGNRASGNGQPAQCLNVRCR